MSACWSGPEPCCDAARGPARPAKVKDFGTPCSAVPLQRVGACFTGPDPYRLLEIEHEDLAVADLAGIGGFFDRLDHLLEHFALDRGLDLDLGQEVDNDTIASYKDWKIGVTYALPKDFTIGAFYTDTDMSATQQAFYTPTAYGARFLGKDTFTVFIQKTF